MIENHLLYKVIPEYIKGRSLVIGSIKLSKLDRFLSRNKVDVLAVNRMVTAKDHVRYHGFAINDTSMSTFIEKLNGRKNLFLFDELHYWSLDQLNELLENSSLDFLVATVVHPFEVEMGEKKSLNPELYNFKVKGDKLFYYPDGKVEEAYVQPKHLPLHFISEFINKRGRFAVERTYSLGAHHVFVIQRGCLLTQSQRVAPSTSAMSFSWLLGFGTPGAVRVRINIFKKLITYLMSLKKPDRESAVAKVRQLCNSEIFTDELLFAVHLGKLIAEMGMDDNFGRQGIVKFLVRGLASLFPARVAAILNAKMANSRKMGELLHFLDEPSIVYNTYKFQKGCVRDYSFIHEFIFDNDYVAEEEDVAQDFEERFFFGQTSKQRMKKEKIDGSYSYTPENLYAASERFNRGFCKSPVKIALKAKEGAKLNVLSNPTFEVSPEELRFKGPAYRNSLFIDEFLNAYKKIQIDGPRFVTDADGDAEMDCSSDIEHEEIHDQQAADEEKPEEDSHNETEEEEAEIFSENSETLSEFDDTKCDSFQIKYDLLREKVEMGGLKAACLLEALSKVMRVKIEMVLAILCGRDQTWADWFLKDIGAELADVEKALSDLDLPAIIHTEDGVHKVDGQGFKEVELWLHDNHVFTEKPLSFAQMGKFSRFTEKRDIFSKMSGNKCFFLTKYPFEIERADALIKSMKATYTGVVMSKFQKIPMLNGAPDLTVGCLFGFAGSGKSRELTVKLRCYFNRHDTLIISPRKFLAEAFIHDLTAVASTKMNIKVKTWELGLKSITKAQVIVIDEISLYPPGYLDLCLALKKKEAQVVVLGDPLQTRYHSKDDALTLKGQADVDRFKIERYLLRSHRLSSELSYMFEFPCLSSEKLHELHGKIYRQEEALSVDLKGSDVQWLVASQNMKRKYSHRGVPKTFGEVQGLTFNFCVVVICSDAHLVSNFAWMVALTRGRSGFCFLVDSVNDKEAVRINLQGRLIEKAMSKKKVTNTFLRAMAGVSLETAEFIEDVETFKTTESVEEKLEGDPWLKSLVPLLEYPEAFDIEPREELRHDSPPKTHLCMASKAHTSILMNEAKGREGREFRSISGWSEQFSDLDHKKGRKFPDVSYAEAYETIYPKHTLSDDVTFWAAIQKRIVKSNPQKEARKLERDMPIGKEILNEVLKVYPLENIWVDLAEHEKNFFKRRVEKSKGLIQSHSNRSDPDWKLDHFFLFMKSQLCTKKEKRFCDAKAGQTLACFAHQLLCRFGVPFRVFEEKVKKQLPKNVYIHTMKNFDQLNDWVKENVDEHLGTESDYEAFDRSQDSLILAFELHLLKHMGWDENLLQDYKVIKMYMGCRLGSLAIMRFTGEFGTFFFNTMANLAFTVLRYNVNRNTRLALAGDDMYAVGKLQLRRDREDLLDKFTLKAKVQFTESPMFCGWYMTPFGIIKEPRLVLERWLIAEEKGTLKECIINYAIEVSYGYRLGEYQYEVIKNIEDQQAIVRKIIKKSKFLPLSVFRLFHTVDNGFGSSEHFSEEMGVESEHHGCCGLECHLH
uniref:RdRp n=1 Tax=Agave betaflexivirus 1 TaxID=2794400 RepID=A0A7T5QZ54_9VIRU|nr:RdRp [Agave betaflexivirus 1]